MYVDDIILTSNGKTGLTFVEKKLVIDFQIKDLGTIRYFLGMEFAMSKSGILVNQRKYILDLLIKIGCKVTETLIEQNLK